VTLMDSDASDVEEDAEDAAAVASTATVVPMEVDGEHTDFGHAPVRSRRRLGNSNLPILFDGGVAKAGGNRWTQSAGHAEIAQLLVRHFVVIRVPEHLSSQLCPGCQCQTDFPFRRVVGGRKPVLRVKRCSNPHCRVQVLHRDGHACLAFTHIVWSRIVRHSTDAYASRW